MQNRIDTLEQRLLDKADEPAKPEEMMEKTTAKVEVKGADKGMVDTQPATFENVAAEDPFVKNMYGIPVYYQMPVVDAQGRVIQHLPVERTRRSSEGGIAAMIAKLCFKKKSRQDIVKLVSSGDLVPAQLIQIKSGMEKGLTEGQLVELINNNVSAEKMKEIIEIAVLENSMID